MAAVQKQAKQLSEDWLSQISNYFTPAKGNNNWNYYDNQMKNNSNQYYQQVKNDADFQYERLKKDTAYELQQARSQETNTNRKTAENKSLQLQQANALQQQNVARQTGGRSSSSTSSGSAFGKWSGSTLSYTGGMPNMRENNQRIQDFNFQRDQAAQSASMISRAEAAGDVVRQEAQAKAQRSLVDAQSRADIDKMNRQNAADMNKMRLQNSLSSRESAADRAQRDRLAKLDAATRLQQSMWGSFSNNAGSGGFQYWGGSI